jgi:hypothetical protein
LDGPRVGLVTLRLLRSSSSLRRRHMGDRLVK